MQLTYQVQLKPDPDGGFLATFPDVPEAIAGGLTESETLDEAAKALFQGLLSYPERGMRLPAPREKTGRPVNLPAQQAVKLAVLDSFIESGISKSELARRIGRGETEARRILDPDHGTKLALLEEALAAMGKQLSIGFAPLEAAE